MDAGRTQVAAAGPPLLLPERRRAFPRVIASAAGPALIVTSVLVVLHGFWWHERLTSQQVDLLSWWLPRWCAMGKAVAAGHIPTWLPNQFGGVPFASDPQSGWLYLPVMTLFGALPCTRALGLTITVNPILAGLGMYLFFRHEGISRIAATAGGLALALPIAGSAVALSMPFSGTLAWTALTLATVSGFLNDARPPRRIVWLAMSCLAWAQLAAAHMTDGLLIGTLTVALYALARLLTQIRSGERSVGSAGLSLIGLAVALPVAAAAMLLPRIALLPRTSIGHGYAQLGALTRQLGGFSNNISSTAVNPVQGHGVGLWWVTAFARAPGGYVGALTILVMPAAFAVRRWRLPAIGFAVAGLVGVILNLNGLIAARPVRRFALSHGLGELWLHSPGRFRYLLFLAFAGLAGYGLQVWLNWAVVHGRRDLLLRAAMCLPIVAVFVLAPLLAGAHAASYTLFLVGGIAAAALLVAASAGRSWAAALLPVLLAVELVAAGFVGQFGRIPGQAITGLRHPPNSGLGTAFATYYPPRVVPSDYVDAGAIGRALIRSRGDFGRYISFAPGLARGSSRGFLFRQSPKSWPSYANGRGTLLGLWDVQGYSPVQVFRYWLLLRRLDTGAPIYYNSATLQVIPPQVLKLFGVEWVVQRSGQSPPPNSSLQATEGSWSLYKYDEWQSRASVVYSWQVLKERQSLDAAIAPGFDPATDALLERTPTIDSKPIPSVAGGASGPRLGPAASYDELSPEHVRVHLSSGAPGVLVVRNVWDPNWHATIDGRPAPIQVADFLMQGVAVPAGDHVVDLTYQDGLIGVGLAISLASYALLAVLFFVLRARRGRMAASPNAEPSSG